MRLRIKILAISLLVASIFICCFSFLQITNADDFTDPGTVTTGPAPEPTPEPSPPPVDPAPAPEPEPTPPLDTVIDPPVNPPPEIPPVDDPVVPPVVEPQTSDPIPQEVLDAFNELLNNQNPQSTTTTTPTNTNQTTNNAQPAADATATTTGGQVLAVENNSGNGSPILNKSEKPTINVVTVKPANKSKKWYYIGSAPVIAFILALPVVLMHHFSREDEDKPELKHREIYR